MSQTKQKIIKVGNSLAVTLPAFFVKECHYKVGDSIIVELDTLHRTLFVKPYSLENKLHLTPEFFEWLEEIVKKNKDLIKELANR